MAFQRGLDNDTAAAALNALAHPVRLAVFRRLMAHGPDGMPAGRLAEAVDLAPSALSFHLNRLKQVGLVSAQREGQQTIYRANLRGMRDLVQYLDATCCEATDNGCGPQCPPQTLDTNNTEDAS